MLHSRSVKLAMVAGATLVMAFLVVVSGSSHEEDAAPGVIPCDGPDPDPAQPVPMPRGLIGLEITLGLKDTQATEWEGDIQVSEGRVLELDALRSGPNAHVE